MIISRRTTQSGRCESDPARLASADPYIDEEQNMKTEHAATMPGFTAALTLGGRGRYAGVATDAHPSAIYPAVALDGREGQLSESGHFCRGVCWCCERYTTPDCCYACAVCYIVESA